MTPIPYFLLSLLVTSHVIVDRISLSEGRARSARSVSLLARHALQLGFISALVLLFAYSRLIFAPQTMAPSAQELVLLLLAAALGHFVLDLFHLQIDGGEPRETRSDVADQLLHLGVLIAAVSFLATGHGEWQRLDAGDLIILGQTVRISRFGVVLTGIALSVWAVTQGLRPAERPAEIARSAFLRVATVFVAFIGPLWLSVLFCGGACTWQFRSGREKDGWYQLAGLSIIAFALRVLRPD